MSILDLHADELLGAARNTPYIPQPKPEPKTSFWGALTAAPRGVSAGAAESSGFLADVLGAFGQAYATTYTGDLAGGMSDVQRQQTAEARAQMQKGLEWSSEAGDLFRGVADSYRPDPRTASTAERLVFDFSRFATKAIGYSVAAGPVAGAGLVAADEGLTAADALKRQGVDLGTRTAVGAVQGIGAGLGVLLPASGATLAGTAGLVAAGGPGSFIAQQAITREILKAADFGHLADQYDPFDPVGLAVATLVPAGFGAYGLRRSRLAAEAAKVTPEQVDAALVAHQTEVRDASTLAAPDDLAGQARHADALARAEDQMAAGEPVAVEVPPQVLAEPMQKFADDLVAGTRAADAEARSMGLTPEKVTRADVAPPPLDAEAKPAGAPPKPAADAAANPKATAAMLDAGEVPPPQPADVAAMTARLTELQTQNPDLQVMLDGMDKPAKLSDFLAAVQREADDMRADAPDFMTAAECFLSFGA